MTACALMVCRVRVKAIFAASDRACWIVVIGGAGADNRGFRIRASAGSRRSSRRWNRRARGSRGRRSGNRSASGFRCRFRPASTAMSGAGATTRGIGGRPIGADRGNLRAGRTTCDAFGRLCLGLYDLLLMRHRLLVDTAVTGASAPTRRHRRRPVLADRSSGLRLKRRGRHCRDSCCNRG
jgi:hypothetical protein